MSKLEKLSFYSKLFDLFDANKPKAIPAKIQEVIAFLEKYLPEYESLNGYQELSRQQTAILEDLQKAFKNSETLDSGWGFCITNGVQKHQINLRPIHDFLDGNPMFIPEMKELNAFIQMELLHEGNVGEFKRCAFIIRELITILDGKYAKVW